MDLSGPAQVFYEASNLGPARYTLTYCSTQRSVHSEQGLLFSQLTLPQEVTLKPGDIIVIPGIDFKSFTMGEFSSFIKTIRPWLKRNMEEGIQLATICSGSLILAEAGLLDGRRCTTHWKCIDYMQQRYPNVQVLSDRLYVEDGPIYTSAGMTSGIDMALGILERHHGPMVPARVAREMVVYARRNDTDTQDSIYLDYRTHFNPAIHRVQDYIVSNPSKNPTLDELASVGNTSTRNLTRAFRKATGHTIIEYKNTVKIALAKTLVHNADYTLDKVASLCGFESVRHFRRVWSKHNENSPGVFKREKV